MVWIKWVHPASSLINIKASTPSKKIPMKAFSQASNTEQMTQAAKNATESCIISTVLLFLQYQSLARSINLWTIFWKMSWKKIKALMNFAAQWKGVRYSPDGSEIQPTLQQVDMQTIYDNHICIYTIYPLYNESIVIISQSLCIHIFNHAPNVIQTATPLAWMMKVYRSWWHPVEPHLNPENPTPRGIFGW